MQPTVNNLNQYTQNPITVNPLNRQASASNVNPAGGQAPQGFPQQPTASVGAVQIFINNPTVNTQGQPNNNLAGQPIADQFVPSAINTAPPTPVVQAVTPQVVPVPVAPPPPQVAPVPIVPPPNNIAAQTMTPEKKVEEKKEEVKTEETTKKEKKPSVPLTKEYIMTLENYIKSENPDIRLMGIKELLKRFKEDDTRKTDQALTNLLNYALQDDQQQIRLYSLMMLDAGYAKGDDFTYKLLTDLQKSDKVFNQDSLTASQILLKRASNNTLEKVEKSDDVAYLERKTNRLQSENDKLKADMLKEKEAKKAEVGKKLNLLAG
jgi:hypothetical protein